MFSSIIKCVYDLKRDPPHTHTQTGLMLDPIFILIIIKKIKNFLYNKKKKYSISEANIYIFTPADVLKTINITTEW